MTSAGFKKGINNELKYTGCVNKVRKVTQSPNFETTLIFESPIGYRLLEWLNKRFKNGVTLSNTSFEKNVVYINHPKKVDEPVVELTTLTAVTICKSDFEWLIEHYRDSAIIEHIVNLTTERSEEAKKMFEEKFGA